MRAVRAMVALSVIAALAVMFHLGVTFFLFTIGAADMGWLLFAAYLTVTFLLTVAPILGWVMSETGRPTSGVIAAWLPALATAPALDSMGLWWWPWW